MAKAVPLFLAVVVVLVADTTVSRRVLRREAGGMPSCRFTAPTTPASPSPVNPCHVMSSHNEEDEDEDGGDFDGEGEGGDDRGDDDDDGI